MVNGLKVVALFFVIAVVIALLLPPVTRSREAARRTQCKNNLKQIALGLNAYEAEYGVFPPAYTVNSEGQPLHSWRTLILPYLGTDFRTGDLKDLYDKIDLSKPWDDPANAEAYKTPVVVYMCPSVHKFGSEPMPYGSMTTYLGVVTDDSCLRPIESLKKKEVSDALASTMLVFETLPEHAVHWMQPGDADLEMILNSGSQKLRAHAGGEQCAFVDGSVRFMSVNTPEPTIRALVSAHGGEIVGDF